MIPDQWFVVLESGEVRAGRLLAVKRMGENLVQGDSPIASYRMRRDQLIREAQARQA
jgi:hypothetical protein